jgi:hypothetical protein
MITMTGHGDDFLYLRYVDDIIINTPCGLCRSSDVRRAIGEKTLNDSGCLNFDFDALRSLPQGSSHISIF